MILTIRRERIIGIIGLSLLLSVVPACSAVAGNRQPSAQGDSASTSRYRVLRPLLPGPPQKAYYLSGYAGATYPPLGAGPSLDPTGYSARPRRSLFSFGQNWWGH